MIKQTGRVIRTDAHLLMQQFSLLLSQGHINCDLTHRIDETTLTQPGEVEGEEIDQWEVS